MKTQNYLHIGLLVLSLATITACSPKNQPRQVHEEKREWTAKETPDDPSVNVSALTAYNLEKGYKDAKSDDPSFLLKNVLQPLSDLVLNARFIEDPRHRTTRMLQMIHIFNEAFLKGLDRGEQGSEFKKLKEMWYATVFAGCSSDLKNDCINADYMANDARFTRILTKLAQDLDPDIDSEIKDYGTANNCVEKSARCRALIEERYRRLAMANMKRNKNDDSDFSFAYLKYSRAFASLMDWDKKNGMRDPGYIAEVHSKIFETIIARYNPKSVSAPEFRTFVENFNPWTYSQKRADAFQYGTKIMFKFGSECCLYKDAEKTTLSESVKNAISESQKDADTFGPSFLQMIKSIQEKFGDRIFDNLGMANEKAKISNLNSGFYDEYFLIVDRLFRGHLNSSEAEMVLRNTPQSRTQVRLPEVISTYLKVYLIHMLVETNTFMNSIYTSNIASDKVFEEATSRSRELTSRWHTIQSQIDLLERVMGSYFKGSNIFSPAFADATRLIKSVNRNIHYISVYPNMIVMNYFLAKMKGKIVINTWWGTIEINADTILDAFFDGLVGNSWFRFGKDAETLDRQMLLYGWDYMLSTGALKGIDRPKFFELIFTKYVDDNLSDLRKKINDFERDTFGSSVYGNLDAICSYELDNKGIAPGIKINFTDLTRYTYSGLGDNSINLILNKLMFEPSRVIANYRNEIDFRLTYIRTMIDLVERDLIREGKIQAAGEAHPDTAAGYSMLKEFEDLKLRISRTFLSRHKRLFDCALRLQEVERRRANRLYEAERAHLSTIFDLMKPLTAIQDQRELTNKVQEINSTYFRSADGGYKFDQIHGLTYRMSKYDLLMRIKKNIENDIFVNLTSDEQRIYRDSNREYVRPRHVSVFMPEGLVRDDMMTKETANTIYLKGSTEADREAFIKDGMAAFNGKTGSFVEWEGQRSNDKGLLQYVYSLEEFYLLGPVTDTDGKTYEVTPSDLSSAFVKVWASYTMDEMDIKNALELKTDGRFDNSFFTNVFFEPNGNRLPFFYDLMLTTKGRAGTNIEGQSDGSTAARDAYAFAQTMINLRTFVFKPSPQIEISVKKHYGDRANFAFQRVADLYEHLSNLEKEKGDAKALDTRLSQAFFLIDGRPAVWYAPGIPMVDQLKRNDHIIQIDDFARRTDNFFQTRERVTVRK